MTDATLRPAEALRGYTRRVFEAAGLATDKARAVAQYLVEADMMGHTTHGLALAPWYLAAIGDGTVPKDGEPQVISDRGAAVCWRGRRLPGAWLAEQAMLLACERAREYGTTTVVVGDSHHNGALAAYLPIATGQGLMAQIASSSPSGAQVAPFGGLKGVMTPNPVAYGIPAPGRPILIDLSASITTVNLAQRMIRRGDRYDHDWVMDAQGNPSRDPEVLTNGGTLLPTGGLDHGQKGYGQALAVEALTQGLAGYGRADAPKGTNAAMTITVHDPEAFGGAEDFLRQTGWLAQACLSSPPRDPAHPVRLPGEAAQTRRDRALAEGVTLYPGIWEALAAEADARGVHWDE